MSENIEFESVFDWIDKACYDQSYQNIKYIKHFLDKGYSFDEIKELAFENGYQFNEKGA